MTREDQLKITRPAEDGKRKPAGYHNRRQLKMEREDQPKMTTRQKRLSENDKRRQTTMMTRED